MIYDWDQPTGITDFSSIPQHQRREFSVVCLANDFPYRLFDNAKIISIKIFFVVGILSSLQTTEYHKYKASHFLLKGIREGMLGGLFGGFIGDLTFLPPLFYPIIIFKD